VKHAPLLSAFVLGGLLAGGALSMRSEIEALIEPCPNVLVGGWVPPAWSELPGWLESRSAGLAEREAFLKLPESVEGRTFGELGLVLDVDATLEAVRQADAPVAFGTRLYRLYRPDPDPVDVPLVFRFDAEVARHTLERFRESVRREPVNARLDLERHQNVPDVPGRELDVPSTLDAIDKGERVENAWFEVATIPVEAAVTQEMLTNVDVSRVLASYETDFSRKRGPRVLNIRRAAEYLNGVTIGPGEILSFNQTVGPRTAERGFVEAPEILGDEMVPGMGGGVCQVASTLHGAAIFGALEIVSRRSHSRPSGYTPLGLDATVIYGEVDLKIKNPYDTPLLVHALLPTPTTIRVELLGRDPPGKVEHQYYIRQSEEFVRRIVYKDELMPGEQRRHQKGIKGYDVRSVVKLTHPDGTVTERRYSSRYWPVPEIYWLGPRTDPAILPGLPEGASHVEIAGEAAPLAHDDTALTERERRELSGMAPSPGSR
jgi:vancomycin resistance protein YoaR